jgi:hypothetical protein
MMFEPERATFAGRRRLRISENAAPGAFVTESAVLAFEEKCVPGIRDVPHRQS